MRVRIASEIFRGQNVGRNSSWTEMITRLNPPQPHSTMRWGAVCLTVLATVAAGTLCGAPAGAQNGQVPAISPAPLPQGALPGAAIPQVPAVQTTRPLAPAPEKALVSLRFEDAPVADLLRMIAEEGNVEISIRGDVVGTLKYINIVNEDPGKAIERVAEAGGLQWRKLGERSFVVAQNLPPEPSRAEVPAILNTVPVNPFSGTGVRALLPPKLDDIPELLQRGAQGQATADQPRDYHYLRVRNLPPSMIAWLIDPANHDEPLVFRQSRHNVEKYFENYLARPAIDPNAQAVMNGNGYYNPYTSNNVAPGAGQAGGLGQFLQPYTQGNAQFGSSGGEGGGGGGRGGRGGGGRGGGGRRGGGGGNQQGGAGGGGGQGLFDLTDQGVDSIIAVDPQNALLVYGTEQGVRALETIIQYLDRPLRQVEIEAQFVNVTTTDATQFGIDFNSANGPFTVNSSGNTATTPPAGSFSVGFVRGNFQATLQALIRQDRAKIVNSPRVTAINNLTATLFSSTTTPVILTSSQGGIGGQVGQSQNLIGITTSIGLTVTPTINNDDTITVVMQPVVSTQNPTALGVPQVFTQTVQTVANVKDGDTIALGGLRTKAINRGGARVPVLSNIPLIGQFFRSRSVNEQEGELIIFLTARIIRRLDETEAVPGT